MSVAAAPKGTSMSVTAWTAIAALAWLSSAGAADFGSRGGPVPANVGEVVSVLRQDPYDMELLISFGTSKGGSAGHLALALRDGARGDDLVYSANFYADRASEHEKGFYTADLMLAIPKTEYLFATTSTLGDTASFGLDFGEIYKRSVVGVRVYGVPAAEKESLAMFFGRINRDFHARARNVEYHAGEVKYDYLQMNCAKTIGSAFRYGAGYRDLEVTAGPLLPGRKVKAAVTANIPTEMALKLMRAWDARGYRMDVVLYRKYPGSAYVDPHEEDKVAFKDLPNRFPSVLSRDFRKEEGEYRDVDNLFAMYLLHNLGKYRVSVNGQTHLLEMEGGKAPMLYREAVRLATESAAADAESYGRRRVFRPKGTRIGETGEGAHGP